jgi:hypothetical protein
MLDFRFYIHNEDIFDPYNMLPIERVVISLGNRRKS